MTERIIRFGPFELRPDRGQLLNRGVPVRLGSRALAILTLLVERSGTIISAREITNHVWPNLFVQENNLRVHITAIRRVLRTATFGEIEIINVPGRGYRLQAQVTVESAGALEPQTLSRLQPRPLPLPINRLIGRVDCVASVLDGIDQHRLVTIVGAGGIGKTSVALAAMSALTPGTAACFVDLSNCTTTEHVATAAAAALQSPMGNDTAPMVLVDRLRDAELILLLDNCEHLIEIVARIAEMVLQLCPRLKLLATSREPLRVPGEFQIPLLPLPVPDVADATAVIADSPAAALFVERIQEGARGFSVTDDNAPQIAAVCRSLDGLPLAIELAAAAVPLVGIDALSSGLTRRLSLLAFGRRTLARHESLDAMLDWSFELLSPAERKVLSYLGCFRSTFDLSAAVEVAALEGDAETGTERIVLQLAAKSLLAVDTAPQGTTYRILETTKVYARRKLDDSGETGIAARRHARWVRALLERAREDWVRLERTAWWARYGPAIDDVRAALEWSLGEGGDTRLGVSLTLGSAPLWIGLAQFAEYNRWLEQALATLEVSGEGGDAEEIQLQIGLCVLLFNAERPGAKFVQAATQVLTLGRKIGDPWAQATGLWLLSGYRQIEADYTRALALARQMAEVEAADPDPELRAFAMRVIALMAFRVGRIAESAAIGASLVADLNDRTAFGAVLRYDHSVVTRGHYAMTLAIEGRLDTALRLISEAVADGQRLRNPATLCYLLIGAACPVALWLGKDDLARTYADLLAREASDNRFTYMGELAACYARIIDMRAGRASGAGALGQGQPLLPHDRNVFISTCAALCDAEAAAQAEAGDPHWATAEILRAHGEACLARDDTAAARRLFSRALSIAEAQGSGLWALRAATSLAGLLPPDEAAPLLNVALARVDDKTWQFSDVRAALALLGARAVVLPSASPPAPL